MTATKSSRVKQIRSQQADAEWPNEVLFAPHTRDLDHGHNHDLGAILAEHEPLLAVPHPANEPVGEVALKCPPDAGEPAAAPRCRDSPRPPPRRTRHHNGHGDRVVRSGRGECRQKLIVSRARA